MTDPIEPIEPAESNEPSVLDYVKSRIKFWQKSDLEIPSLPPEEPAKEMSAEQAEETPALPRLWPWRPLLALALALLAQRTFEPVPGVSERPWLTGTILYLGALGLLLWAYRLGEWTVRPLPKSESAVDSLRVRGISFVASLFFGAITFFLMSGNIFNSVNLVFWALTLLAHFNAFWQRDPQAEPFWTRIKKFISRPFWDIRVTRWAILIAAATMLILFFRLYNLSDVPANMTSDHAEKLADVYDILNGQYSIYFPRNTGREPLYVYLSALIAWMFTGISFLTLKISAVIGGLITLPYMYMLGKELGGKRIGLIAILFAGIAYWPNVIERWGLRISFYPLFVAVTLYYLIRGLRRQSRNDIILAGVGVGLGLNGYTPFRIMPFIVVAAFILYLLHARSNQERKQAVLWLGLLALTAWVLFIPQARYATENLESYGFRAFSRLGSVETPLPGPVWKIFFSNLWNALKTFNWSDGEIWAHSIPGRPALDVVSGALLLIGVVLILIRYIRRHYWVDLFMILSVPLLLMPSILSLAYPRENPALNRAGGAIVPAFLFVGVALDGLLTGFARRDEDAESLEVETTPPVKKRYAHPVIAFCVTAILLVVSSTQNYDLVFHQYNDQYKYHPWNTDEMGLVLKQFALTQGSAQNAWIIPYAYWADTRLPPIWANLPDRGDMGLFRENLSSTLEVTGTKLFMFRQEDVETLNALRDLYPTGTLNLYKSKLGVNWDFYIYVVPAEETVPAAP